MSGPSSGQVGERGVTITIGTGHPESLPAYVAALQCYNQPRHCTGSMSGRLHLNNQLYFTSLQQAPVRTLNPTNIKGD